VAPTRAPKQGAATPSRPIGLDPARHRLPRSARQPRRRDPCYVEQMLGWRRVLGLTAVDGSLFLLSGLTAHSAHHSGTLSNVLWVDFLLGVLLLIAVTTATVVRSVVRSAFALRR
jgi:hypothetical protein